MHWLPQLSVRLSVWVACAGIFSGCYSTVELAVGQQVAATAQLPLQPLPDATPSKTRPPVDRSQSNLKQRTQERQPVSEESGPQPQPGVQLAVFNDAVDTEPDDASDVGESRPAISQQSTLADWAKPRFALFLTGRQHGYMEPCGCTGLENAKGGLSRRHTFLRQLRQRGWDVVALDVGNQVRRFGKQADIKFQRTADILSKLEYAAVGLGPDDLRLSLDGLLAPLSEGNFVCANVDIFELNSAFKVVTAGGIKVGITSVLGTAEQNKANRNAELQFTDAMAAIQATIPRLREEGAQFNVLLAHASLEETRQFVQRFPDVFQVVVTAGGAGEPTLEPERIADSETRIVQVGTKGMYVGMIGVYPGAKEPIRYGRVVLDAEFGDSDEVLDIFADYQKQLEIQGWKGLGIRPIVHPSGHHFVGYEVCADCHTEAAEIFENSPHHHATESLVKPPNSRGAIPRNFDPECISCHVTGWSPQEYFPYVSAYLELSQTALHTNGCENCHGPGSAHVAAESGDVNLSEEQVDKLRAEMRLTVEQAKKSSCYSCHDPDNSPEFDFDKYWKQVEHHGVD